MNKIFKQQLSNKKKQSYWQLVWGRYRRSKGAMIGLILFLVILLITIVSQFAFDYDTDIVGINAQQRGLKPGWEHPFGTDRMGRDLFARVCYGAKYSLIIGFGATMISLLVGSLLGALAGFVGGTVEDVIMRIVELLLMVPGVLLVILIVYVLGASVTNLMLGLGICTIPHFARNARAAVLTVRSNEYVESARAQGAKETYILMRHVIPNALSSILVQATSRVAGVILEASSFSFLGLGVPSPIPEWGAMISDAKIYIRTEPHLIIFPGLALMITILSINMIGDGLRDAMDPKLKR